VAFITVTLDVTAPALALGSPTRDEEGRIVVPFVTDEPEGIVSATINGEPATVEALQLVGPPAPPQGVDVHVAVLVRDEVGNEFVWTADMLLGPVHTPSRPPAYLSPTLVAALREGAMVALVQTGLIRRRVDGAWVTVTNGVRCRVRMSSRQDLQVTTPPASEAGGRVVVTCEAGTQLLRDDVLIVEGRRITILSVEPDADVHVQAYGYLDAEPYSGGLVPDPDPRPEDLTGDELAAMRIDAVGTLPQRCTIRRRDESGWQDVDVEVPCRLRVVASAGGEEGGTEATFDRALSAKVTLPHGTDVRRFDRLAVGSRRMTVRLVEPDKVIHMQALGPLEEDGT
jgi:hypothetical protein